MEHGEGTVGVGVELTVRCAACAAAVPVNAVASEVACPECAHAIALGAELWTTVLREASERAAALAPNQEIVTTLESDGGSMRALLRRVDPTCASCGSPLALPERPPAVVACSKGHPTAVRTLPLAPAGVRYLLGEAPTPEPGAAPAPLVFHCAACGAPLSSDGQADVIACRFCGVDNRLTDEAKKKLRARPVRRWFVACQPRAVVATLASWSSATHLAMGAGDRVYLLGADDGGPLVASFDARMRLAWVSRSVGGIGAHGRIACQGDTVIVHAPGSLAAVALRASDGEVAFTFPPAGARLPFDPARALGVALDVDGTLLVVAAAPPTYGRNEAYALLYRMTPGGELLPTWPGAAPTREIDLGEDIPRLDLPFAATTAVGSPRGLVLTVGRAADPGASLPLCALVGHDGLPYLCDGRWLVRLDRSGRSDRAFPSPRSGRWDDHGLGVDARGFVHALTADALLRIDPGAELAQRVARRASGGPLGAERLLAVAPDGTAAVADAGSALRVVQPDGAVSFVSPASRRADET